AIVRSRIWFDDGNVILQVDHVQFRVHRGVLARHSSVLNDMFSIPQPVEPDLAVDGCPVVILPDLARDWEELLGYIYDGVKKRKDGEIFGSGLVAAMLRLGHKYGFEAWKEEAVLQFKKLFPHKKDSLWFEACWPPKNGTLVLDPDDSFCDLVNLAYQMRLNKCLPSMFLVAIVLPDWPSALFAGMTSENGRHAAFLPEIIPFLVKGRENVHRAMLAHMYSWQLHQRPCGSLNCQVLCANMYDHAVARQSKIVECRQQWYVALPTVHQLCSACRRSGEASYERGVKRLWQLLPTYVGLPEWEKLRNF
ncbi:hypothetical protein BKA70DRAFT_1079137, partial [Coprinopsis sp. MPI-PUGE-AT-0042]